MAITPEIPQREQMLVIHSTFQGGPAAEHSPYSLHKHILYFSTRRVRPYPRRSSSSINSIGRETQRLLLVTDTFSTAPPTPPTPQLSLNPPHHHLRHLYQVRDAPLQPTSLWILPWLHRNPATQTAAPRKVTTLRKTTIQATHPLLILRPHHSFTSNRQSSARSSKQYQRKS